jgi:hypothetical protein
VRLGLDGQALVEIPAQPTPDHGPARPTWMPTGDATRLLHVGAEGITAYDAKTGAEQWSTSY